MTLPSLYHQYKRYRTLQTDRIFALPIVILMPHSSCNCRCVICDIWKANAHLKQLSEEDLKGLLSALRKFGTRQVLMSGGEALLHPGFFSLCGILKKEDIRVTLHSTGLTIQKHAGQLLNYVDDIIVSLDGAGETHDRIRNIPGAFQKLKNAVASIKQLDPRYRITARTVIHKLNFREWPEIVSAARDMGLDQLSFLPADVSSHAFNREILWSEERKYELLPDANELPVLARVIDELIRDHSLAFESGFIAENPDRIRRIYGYYAAFHGLSDFLYKKCNAPWVSTVIEPDGTVRPCFFHSALGNIRDQSLDQILNSDKAIRFRKELDMEKDPTCLRCVCSLNLAPGARL